MAVARFSRRRQWLCGFSRLSCRRQMTPCWPQLCRRLPGLLGMKQILSNCRPDASDSCVKVLAAVVPTPTMASVLTSALSSTAWTAAGDVWVLSCRSDASNGCSQVRAHTCNGCCRVLKAFVSASARASVFDAMASMLASALTSIAWAAARDVARSVSCCANVVLTGSRQLSCRRQ
jgi:hypothetical protein